MECLANALHVQELEISQRNHRRHPALMDVAIRPGGNDVVGRLLCSPQSHLKILHLAHMDLEDHRFISSVEALPTSQLQQLNVSDNRIKSSGIMAFAEQLPNIKCLRDIDISANRWESESNDDVVWEKLLEGVRENYTIESLDTLWGGQARQSLLLYELGREETSCITQKCPIGTVALHTGPSWGWECPTLASSDGLESGCRILVVATKCHSLIDPLLIFLEESPKEEKENHDVAN